MRVCEFNLFKKITKVGHSFYLIIPKCEAKKISKNKIYKFQIVVCEAD